MSHRSHRSHRSFLSMSHRNHGNHGNQFFQMTVMKMTALFMPDMNKGFHLSEVLMKASFQYTSAKRKHII